MSSSTLSSTLAFLFAVASALIVTRFVGSLALRWGVVDPVDSRKMHTTPVPRLGGIAIFASVAAALVLLGVFAGFRGKTPDRALVSLLLGGAAIFALGLYDDLKPLRARYKLMAQLVIASAVTVGGFTFSGVSLQLLGVVNLPLAVSVPLTIIWLVGVTNAFNLIDGVDGLAGGIAVIALTSMLVVGLLFGNSAPATVALIVAGASIGFLCHNFQPASIFLGDSGSLFIGFMLGGLGLLTAMQSGSFVAVMVPIVVLGLPIIDTALTIFRRFLRAQPIFSPDRGHVHHRLLDRGHSPRNVVLLLYIAASIFGVAGCLLALPMDFVILLVVAISVMVCLILGFLIHHLGFIEFQELGRLVSRGARPRATISRNVRFREASRRLAELENMEDIFASLAEVFMEQRTPRAELRLQPFFLKRGPSPIVPEVREYDEVSVWQWERGHDDHSSWWEVVLPLLSADRRRIGSLVIWEDGKSASSLSHLHVISSHLRGELEHKLQLFGWGPELLVDTPAEPLTMLERPAGRIPSSAGGIRTEV